MLETVQAGEHISESEKARESNERMRLMLDSTPLCVHIWDENSRIIDCNQAAVTMFGLSSKEEYIRRYFELTPEFQPDGMRSVDKARRIILETLETGNKRLEWMRQSLDKEPIPVELTLIRVDFREKKYIAGYNRDLREQKRMLGELEAAQLTTSTMFESNPQINILFDQNFKVINCNPAAVKFWGFSTRQEFLDGIVQRIKESIPVRQPSGRLSASLEEYLFRALREDDIRLKTELLIDGAYRSLDVEFKKIPYESSFAVVCYIYDVTENRERERELLRMREQNELQLTKLNLMVKATKIGLWDMEANGKDPVNPDNSMMWSQEFRRLLGHTDENDFPNRVGSVHEIMHPEDYQWAPKALAAHILDKTGNTPYGVEFRLKKKNGEYGYFRSSGETIRDEKGNPIRVAGALMDITETKNLLLNTQLQLAKLNMAVKATGIALWEMEVDVDPVNPVNRVTWSDELRHQLGFTDKNDFPDSVASLQFILHPDDKQKAVDALVNHLSDKTGKTPYDTEYRARKKNGEYGFYRGTGETIRDNDGNPLRVAGTQMDITETKNEILKNELQLIKMNLMLKSTKIVLWDLEMEIGDTDPLRDDKVALWSDDFRRLLGFTDEKDFPNLVGSVNNRFHPDDREENIKALEVHLLDKTGKTPYASEFRLRKKNGEYGFYRASGETIRDSEGNAIRVAGSLMDISETKNLIRELERQKLDADAANKAKSAFLSTMSHEIRTPMNAILGITEIMLQNESLSPEMKEAVEKINNSGDLLLGIINDILDLSKIEAGKMEIIVAKYEISSLISDTAQLNIMHIGSKPIEFELEISEHIPAVLLGDELRIKQILNNILSNAFKYTKEGTVKMSVSPGQPSGNEDEVSLVVCISDTGPGMTKEQVGRLFHEYARFNVEANRSTVGTGLGMSITKNLIHLMRGEISIESEPGVGTSIEMTIPQGRSGTALLGREVAENLHNFRTSSKSQMKRVQISREPMPYGSVLIVDDVETNIYVAKGLLSPYRLKMDSADSGYAAIEKIRRGNTYDIIFMDHMMPKMDGIEATKIIRKMGYKNSIVALTANAVAGQVDIFLDNGFDDFISKPIDIRQLNSVLNKLVRDKQPPEIVEEARKSANLAGGLSVAAPPASLIPPEIFIRDARKTIRALETMTAENDYVNADNLRSYIINVHGIKSALANMGNTELSAVALKLEMAGRGGIVSTITSETPAFLDSLRHYTEEISSRADAGVKGKTIKNITFLKEKLLAIKAACEEYDGDSAERELTELRNMAWLPETGKVLDTVYEKLLHSDFPDIINILEKFINTL